MQVSVVVALICTGILALVVYMRWSMITALIASLEFAATAIGTIASSLAWRLFCWQCRWGAGWSRRSTRSRRVSALDPQPNPHQANDLAFLAGKRSHFSLLCTEPR